MNSQQDQSHNAPRKQPSRLWYLVSAAVLLGSAGLFVGVLVSKSKAMRGRINPMPRFVGPTDEAGVIVTIDQPDKLNIFYENLGTFNGRTFNTPRHQVWTTFDGPAMYCKVTHVASAKTVDVHLPGFDESNDKRNITKDLIYAYNLGDRQGHGVWVFNAQTPGDYRIVLTYDDAVLLEPKNITIPPELTKAQKAEMVSGEGATYEAARRDAIERAALAELKPIDVLFAVGPDPTQGSYFNVIGLKGAATVFAFGFTFSALTALVTLMLRSGHVTPRGQLADVRRFGQ